eukprot:Tamp_32378.p1 GENE.Tamp_32378~~Tamp_32378.p1  ORF type:complete len:100 (+),score=35.96 Tamp_32378:150-449(+)
MSDTESKPVKGENDGEGSEHINLKVKGQDGNIVHFKIKKKTQLKKLMEAYCARQSLRMDQTRFLYHGIECQETHTPAELDIKEDDVIDSVVVHDPINVR